MPFPCLDKVICEGSDDPVANLSSEGYDFRRFYAIVYPPVIGMWRDSCCDYTCISTISQNDAFLCAMNRAVLAANGLCSPKLQPDGSIACTPDSQTGLFWNTEQCGTSLCEDGSVFTSCIAANTVSATSQEEADAIALSMAQRKAEETKFCCGTNVICCCVGQFFSFNLTVDGGAAPFAWVAVSGAWPTGVNVSFADSDNREALIVGTATVAGTTVVDFIITDPDGNFLTKSFTLHAIEITTLALAPFTVGVPYSSQLMAIGGSGNYAWRIASGTLPAGLTMSVGGLISGTPTQTITSTLIFQVIDLTCETTNRLFYPPRVRLTGNNTTTTATVRGFEPYFQTTTPPKRYKKLAWTGTSEQWSTTFAGQPCSGAKYVWSGVSEIDLHGNFISKYHKEYFAMCSPDNNPPAINTTPDFGLAFLQGYCWPPDPSSCPTCTPSPYAFVQDMAANSIADGTTFLNDPLAGIHTTTQFSLTNISGSTITGFIEQRPGFPDPPQIILHSSHNYSSLISDEYTDADALSVATVITGNGLVAENRPRTTGYNSYFTTVQFFLSCTNLINGENYIASVEFWDSSGTKTIKTYNFTATGPMLVLNDTIPTPAAGHTVEVRNPTVIFA